MRPEEREMQDNTSKASSLQDAQAKLGTNGKEVIWKIPDGVPKDMLKAPAPVAVLKLEAGLPKNYVNHLGKLVKAKVATGAKAEPKKKMTKKVKKAGYG